MRAKTKALVATVVVVVGLVLLGAALDGASETAQARFAIALTYFAMPLVIGGIVAAIYCIFLGLFDGW